LEEGRAGITKRRIRRQNMSDLRLGSEIVFKLKQSGAGALSDLIQFFTSTPRVGHRVLAYHAIGSLVDGDLNSIYSLKPAEFRFHVQAIRDFVETQQIPLLKFESPITDGLCVTFDDGYRDLLTEAAPMLCSASIPFHLFANPDLIESADSRYLSTSELIELSQMPGVTIGAHGFFHHKLVEIPETQLRDELRHSRTWLEQTLQKETLTMSYPFGSVNNTVKAAAISAGFRRAACSQWGFNSAGDDEMMMKRVDMWSGDTARSMRNKFFGSWNWLGMFT